MGGKGKKRKHQNKSRSGTHFQEGQCSHIKDAVKLQNLNNNIPHADLSCCQDCQDVLLDEPGPKIKPENVQESQNVVDHNETSKTETIDISQESVKDSTSISEDPAASNNETACATDVTYQDSAICVCLRCGYIGCSRQSQHQHAIKHYNFKMSHTVVVNLSNWVVWCYQCDQELDTEINANLQPCLGLLKKLLGSKANKSEKQIPQKKMKGGQMDSIVVHGTSVVKGLTNLGNTCFFNSVMQNLCQIRLLRLAMDHISPEDFTYHIKPLKEEANLDPLSVAGKHGPLTLSLAFFLKEMSGDSKKRVINPGSLFSEICKKAPRFKGFRQQDSQELLRYLLDSVRTEEMKIVKQGILRLFGVKNSGNKEGIAPNKVDSETQERIRSHGRCFGAPIIDSLFGGQFVSSVECRTCYQVFSMMESFLDISLSLATNEPNVNNGDTFSKKNEPVAKLSGRNNKMNQPARMTPTTTTVKTTMTTLEPKSSTEHFLSKHQQRKKAKEEKKKKNREKKKERQSNKSVSKTRQNSSETEVKKEETIDEDEEEDKSQKSIVGDENAGANNVNCDIVDEVEDISVKDSKVVIDCGVGEHGSESNVQSGSSEVEDDFDKEETSTETTESKMLNESESKEEDNATVLNESESKEEDNVTELNESESKEKDNVTKLNESESKEEDNVTKLNESESKEKDNVTELNEIQSKEEDNVTKLNESESKEKDNVTKLNESESKEEDNVTKLNESESKEEDNVTELNEIQSKEEDNVTKLNESESKEEDNVTVLNESESKEEDNVTELNEIQSKEEDNVTKLNESESKEKDNVTKLNESESKEEDNVTKLNESESKEEDNVTKLNESESKEEDNVTKLNESESKEEDNVTELNEIQSKEEDNVTKLNESESKEKDNVTKLNESESKEEDNVTKLNESESKEEDNVTKLNESESKEEDNVRKLNESESKEKEKKTSLGAHKVGENTGTKINDFCAKSGGSDTSCQETGNATNIQEKETKGQQDPIDEGTDNGDNDCQDKTPHEKTECSSGEDGQIVDGENKEDTPEVTDSGESRGKIVGDKISGVPSCGMDGGSRNNNGTISLAEDGGVENTTTEDGQNIDDNQTISSSGIPTYSKKDGTIENGDSGDTMSSDGETVSSRTEDGENFETKTGDNGCQSNGCVTTPTDGDLGENDQNINAEVTGNSDKHNGTSNEAIVQNGQNNEKEVNGTDGQTDGTTLSRTDFDCAVHTDGQMSDHKTPSPPTSVSEIYSLNHSLKSLKSTKSDMTTIEGCLRKFCTPELLAGNNKFLCEHCNRRGTSKKNEESDSEENSNDENDDATVKPKRQLVYTAAVKQLLIHQPPPVLTLHLKRFHQVMYSLKKLPKHISFPLVLDIAPFCHKSSEVTADSAGNVLYSLCGVVEHSGNLHSGHYTAYCRLSQPSRNFFNEQFENLPELLEAMKKMWSTRRDGKLTHETLPKSKWYYISDSHVSETSEERVLKAQAYLLFYERIPLVQHNTATS